MEAVSKEGNTRLASQISQTHPEDQWGNRCPHIHWRSNVWESVVQRRFRKEFGRDLMKENRFLSSCKCLLKKCDCCLNSA